MSLSMALYDTLGKVHKLMSCYMMCGHFNDLLLFPIVEYNLYDESQFKDDTGKHCQAK